MPKITESAKKFDKIDYIFAKNLYICETQLGDNSIVLTGFDTPLPSNGGG